MADVKEKVVTVESLATLHEYNTNNFMAKANPTGNGTMTIDGDASFSGNVYVGSFMINSKIKFVPTEDSLEIVFINN